MFHSSSFLDFLFPQRYGKTVTVRPPGNTAILSGKISGVLPGKTPGVFPGKAPCPFVSFSLYISLIIMTRIYRFFTRRKPPGTLPVLSEKGPALRLGISRRDFPIEFRRSEHSIRRIFFQMSYGIFFRNFIPGVYGIIPGSFLKKFRGIFREKIPRKNYGILRYTAGDYPTTSYISSDWKIPAGHARPRFRITAPLQKPVQDPCRFPDRFP